MLLFELEEADALLAVEVGFCGAVGVYAAFGEKVGAAARYYQGCPAIAVGVVSCTICFEESVVCERVTY